MSRTKMVNGERIVFRHIMHNSGSWLPVIRPLVKDQCGHDYESEEKPDGIVCLKCFQFIGHPRIRMDAHIGKIFSDIV